MSKTAAEWELELGLTAEDSAHRTRVIAAAMAEARAEALDAVEKILGPSNARDVLVRFQ